jgi:ubiquinone biosynthesis protein
MGQYLALRPDIVPREYCDELIQLQDRVPPFPWEHARAILAEELGRDPAAVFRSIDHTPTAAGSLAQVHRALLKNGTVVAVKVQRPHIADQIQRDLRRARLLARLLEGSGIFLGISPLEVVEELAEWLAQELDFRRELANLQRLGSLDLDSAVARIPRAVPRLCTARVLTTEFLSGIRFTDLLRSLHPGVDEPASPVDAGRLDYRVLARNLIESTLEQIFRHQFFHADLHPGNLIALSGNVVGYVDFGLCDQLDANVRAGQLRYLAAVYFGDSEGIFRGLTEILVPAEQTDLVAFRRDFDEENRNFQQRGGLGARGDDPTQRSPFGSYLVGLMRAARRHHLQVPARVLSLYRAVLTMETIAQQLGAGDEVRQVGQAFFRRLQMDELMTQLFSSDAWSQYLVSLLELSRNSPRQLNQILTDVAEGSYSLNVHVTEAGRTTRAQNQRARLLTAAILTVSVTLLLPVAPELSAQFGISLAWPLTVLLIALYLWVALLWRRLGR